MLQAILGRLGSGVDLSAEDMEQALEAIFSNTVPDGQIGLFLTSLRSKGESPVELAAAARSLRKHMKTIPTRHASVVDTCGTGGDRSSTFNISTAAAFVVAAAGVPVAKHGNRRVSSNSGSADVLQALGVNIDATPEKVGQCLDEIGIGFCFAPLWHPTMKRVAEIRKKLGVPTIFNLMGPLLNPFKAQYQLIGVSQPKTRSLIANALLGLGTTRSLVVHGRDGLDELTLDGTTDVTEVKGGKCRELHWEPEDFGLPHNTLDDLVINNPQESAEIIRRVFDNVQDTARDIVLMNAAAVLWMTGKGENLLKASELADDTIASGAPKELLARLVEFSNRA